MTKNFNHFLIYVKAVILKQFEKQFVDLSLKNMQQEFAILLPEIPVIADKNNPLTSALIYSVNYLAVYKTLKKMGKDVKEIGKIVLDAAQLEVDNFSFWTKFIKRLESRLMFTKFVKKQMQKDAKKSAMKKYPAGFVYNYIEGDGKNFDFGCDFLECAVCKFFHTQNADEFTPYVCQADFIMSKLTKTTLIRTKTLAEGYCKCDFRYKK